MEMKEIKTMESVYLQDYDVNVNPYLTYSQIQQIINATVKFDTWSDRQQNIDMLVLYHVTDIPIEELNNMEHDVALQSGLIDAVNKKVINIGQIYKGIKYTESINRSLAQIATHINDYLKPVEKVIKKHERV